MAGTAPLFGTILSTNYLPKALALAGSLERHHPGARLVVLVIDGYDADHLAGSEVPGVELVGTRATGLSETEVLHLATTYDLVELATALKPPFLLRLLEEAEQAVYLDPDTYLTGPMEELSPALAATDGGVLLTPHFLDPVPDGADLTEGHLLSVGVYNLGFCAVDRRARAFLDWWWGHLREECLWDPLAGLFVDQKWCDIGSVLFRAGAFRHRGYNVGVANLHERPVVLDADGYAISGSPDRLRLFHFHAFDPHRPDQLSTRGLGSTAHLRADGGAVDRLCRAYAEDVLAHEAAVPPGAAYPYDRDASGRRISRQLRRAYRLESTGPGSLPSPFRPADAEAFAAWRRRALRTEVRELVGDGAKSLRLALPEEYGRLRRRFPALASRLKRRVLRAEGRWE